MPKFHNPPYFLDFALQTSVPCDRCGWLGDGTVFSENRQTKQRVFAPKTAGQNPADLRRQAIQNKLNELINHVVELLRKFYLLSVTYFSASSVTSIIR